MSANTVTIKIEGDREIIRRLAELETKVARKTVADGIKKGLNIVMGRTKRNVKTMLPHGGGKNKYLNLSVIIPKDTKKNKDILGKIRYDSTNIPQEIINNLHIGAFKRPKKGIVGKFVEIKPSPHFVYVTSGRPNAFGVVVPAGRRYYIPAAIEYGHGLAGEGGKGLKTVAPIPFMRQSARQSAPLAMKTAERIILKEMKRLFP